MKIKKFIRGGIFGLHEEDIGGTDQLLDIAGRALDKAYSHEIMGEVVFEGEDGKIYCGTVEYCISEAHPDYVKDVLSQEEE